MVQGVDASHILRFALTLIVFRASLLRLIVKLRSTCSMGGGKRRRGLLALFCFAGPARVQEGPPGSKGFANKKSKGRQQAPETPSPTAALAAYLGSSPPPNKAAPSSTQPVESVLQGSTDTTSGAASASEYDRAYDADSDDDAAAVYSSARFRPAVRHSVSPTATAATERAQEDAALAPLTEQMRRLSLGGSVADGGAERQQSAEGLPSATAAAASPAAAPPPPTLQRGGSGESQPGNVSPSTSHSVASLASLSLSLSRGSDALSLSLAHFLGSGSSGSGGSASLGQRRVLRRGSTRVLLPRPDSPAGDEPATASMSVRAGGDASSSSSSRGLVERRLQDVHGSHSLTLLQLQHHGADKPQGVHQQKQQTVYEEVPASHNHLCHSCCCTCRRCRELVGPAGTPHAGGPERWRRQLGSSAAGVTR